MSAALELTPERPGAPSDDYEALTAALGELTNRCAAHAIEGDRLAARREELLTGAAAARRRRARTALDLHFPPVTFFGIEEADPTPEEIRAFADESVEVDAEIRRLQKLLGRTDRRARQSVGAAEVVDQHPLVRSHLPLQTPPARLPARQGEEFNRN